MNKRPNDRARIGRTAWLSVGLLLLLPSLAVRLGGAMANRLLDWQPGLALSEPWRLWSAAWVHWSDLHLIANLAGGLLVMALGVVAQVPLRAAVAWTLSWPLVHLSLGLQPQLLHYGGLSGVLHAGVAVVVVVLWLGVAMTPGGPARHRSRERLIAMLLAAGLALKLWSEGFWEQELLLGRGWDIAVAPLGHFAGVVWGALAGWICLMPALAARHRLPPGRPRVG